MLQQDRRNLHPHPDIDRVIDTFQPQARALLHHPLGSAPPRGTNHKRRRDLFPGGEFDPGHPARMAQDLGHLHPRGHLHPAIQFPVHLLQDQAAVLRSQMPDESGDQIQPGRGGLALHLLHRLFVGAVESWGGAEGEIDPVHMADQLF